jgi:hypothetical protein
MVTVPAESEALRAEVAKLARTVDQPAEVDAMTREVNAPDGAREVAGAWVDGGQLATGLVIHGCVAELRRI